MTVFALLALSALLLASAVLSNIVQAKIVEAEAEAEARRTARSTLAQFEPGLLAYGLFGTKHRPESIASVAKAMDDGKKAEFASVGSDRFRAYDSASDPAPPVVEPLYHLGDHRVFQQQVLERMKYIAAIEFAIEVSEKLAKSRTQLAQAQQYAELSKRMTELLNKREDALDAAWTKAKSIARDAGSGGGGLQRKVDEVASKLSEAEKANDDLRKELNAPAPNMPTTPETLFPHVTVYPQTYFSGYRSDVAKIASLHAAWLKAKDAEPATEESKAKEERLRERAREAAGEWLREQGEKEEKRRRDGRKLQQLQADQKKAAEQEINRRRDNWKDACELSDVAEYVELTKEGGLYEKYKLYNEHLSSGGMHENLQKDDAESFLESVLKLTQTVLEKAKEKRNEVYLNEYAITHFTYRTYDKQKFVGAVKTGIGDREAHRLQGQEAEYILYGLPDCRLNLSAMHTELFALRTGLRTLEAMMRPNAASAAASPWMFVLASLTEGAKAANEDVELLLSGDAVELPFAPSVTMDYRDHLRLFFLLHAREASAMSRMQALIELNTGIDLMKTYTAVRVRMTYDTPFWVSKNRKKEIETVVSY